MNTYDVILISTIDEGERVRKDLGPIDALSNSIKQHGLIQPIVLTLIGPGEDAVPTLVAGGRRLAAVKRLGIKSLLHGKDFIWRGEENEIQRRAVELEENLQRKELTWQEALIGKQKLLELMQAIHGEAKTGRTLGISTPGFGVNRLAAMLGESPATTSQDLHVASLIQAVPQLRFAKNKSEVLSRMKVAGNIVVLQAVAAKMAAAYVESGAAPVTKSWTLHEVDFRAVPLPTESVDLIWTDLPYGSDVVEAHGEQPFNIKFDDSRISIINMLASVAHESFRVLRNDRYAVFCFGFNFYTDLVEQLKAEGFNVNPVPCIWNKGTKFSASPLTNYCIGYEPILVASKGSPKFVRPGQSNVFNYPPPDGRIHLVQKPVQLVEQFLDDMCVPGSVVVDWCAGTGTTGVAAYNKKMTSILFERDSTMATLAKARLETLK